ncbi:15016_t:CDS:1, partial [Dentiscutata heterogama]
MNKRKFEYKSNNDEIKKIKTDNVNLTEEQKKVVDIVLKGESIFYTGSAGVGKSYLLRYLIKELKLKYPEKYNVAVTASTSIAALNINGVTIHNYSNISIMNRTKDDIINKIRSNKFFQNRIIYTKMLIIDEISMLSCDAFDLINEILQEIRGNQNPFGDVQLIVTGDFFQLPPIPNKGDKRRPYELYIFLSEIWNRTFQQHILLKQVIRQSDEFVINGLNKLRLGIIESDFLKYIKGLERELICEKIIDYFTEDDDKFKCNLCNENIYIRNGGALKRHFRSKHDGIIKNYDDKYEPIILFSDKKAAKS